MGVGRSGRRLVGAAPLALVLAAAGPVEAVPSAAPDATFGARGAATVNFGGVDAPADLALAPDGRIVVVGASTTASGVSRVAVARLLPSGQPDPTFSADGKVVTDAGSGAASAVAVQRDGKVLVATRGGTLLRYTASGSLDRTFSGDGVAPDADASLDVVVRGDGQIGTLGNSINLLTASGALVGSSGDVQAGGAGFRLLAAQSNGDLVSSGASDCNTAPVARWDPSLPGGPTFFMGPEAGVASVGLFALAADKVLVVSSGQTDGSCGTTPAVTFERYLADGTRDATFGTDGAVVVDTQTWPAAAAGAPPVSAALGPNGRVLVLGTSYLARFTAAGALDTSFSGDGILPLAAGTASELAVQPNAHVVLAGENGGDVVVRRYLGSGTVTAYPTSVAVVAGGGRVTAGNRASLAAIDRNLFTVASTTTGATRRTTWSATVDAVPNSLASLRVAHVGGGSASRTQSLAVWNVRTATWVTIDTRRLASGTTATVDKAVPGTLGDYVTGTRGTGRVQVRVSTTGPRSFTSVTDRLAISFR